MIWHWYWKLFYLVDDYAYLENVAKTSNIKEREKFITVVYDDILNGRFLKMDTHFTVPFTKIEKYKLKKRKFQKYF